MNTYLRRQIFILTALLLAGSIFAGAACASSKETRIITGTGSSIGVMEIVARDFQSKRPKASVKVLPGIGSTGGIKAVQAEKIDIGLSARTRQSFQRQISLCHDHVASLQKE